MKTVKFKSAFDHITPAKTIAYPGGWSGDVTNEVAAAAKAAGNLETRNGGRSDQGSAARGTDKAEG